MSKTDKINSPQKNIFQKVNQGTLKPALMVISLYILLSFFFLMLKQYSVNIYAYAIQIINEAMGRAGLVFAGFYLVAIKPSSAKNYTTPYSKFIKLSGLVGFSTTLTFWLLEIDSLHTFLIQNWIVTYLVRVSIFIIIFITISITFGFLYKYLEQKDSRLGYWGVVVIVLFTIIYNCLTNTSVWISWFQHAIDPLNFPPGPHKIPIAFIFTVFLVLSVTYSVVFKHKNNLLSNR